MKPFDIETYKADPSREIVTRDGKKARIICTDVVEEGDMIKYPIVALILTDGRELVNTYTKSGHVFYGKDGSLDLFFASVKHKGWINIYEDLKGFHGEKIYEREELARVMSNAECVATIPIEWEE